MIYSSCDTEQNRLQLIIFDHFFPFYPPKNPTNRDIIILHLCTKNLQFLSYRLRKTDFLSYWAIFALLSPNDPKYQNFEKMKKLPGDIILLHIHVHHKWRSYDIWFWNARCNRHIFCHFGSFFALLPPINLDNRNFEKMKKLREILSFHKCVPKMTIIWWMDPEISWHHWGS